MDDSATDPHRHHHSMPPPPIGGLLFDGGHRGGGGASTPSDNDDDSFDTADDGGGKPKKGSSSSSSPWHRMKWTDDMVRLLIAVVSYIGDDESTAAPRSALQKKGKWKAVSQLMLDKGCSVSPQQCEDKFNDLNKRYKRLNEILGHGTTCEVVENPTMLDFMPHVASKSKDVVRKILSSKHLFYREMCAYHNGPRAAAAGSHELESHGNVPPNGGSEESDEEDDNGEDEEGSDGLGRGVEVSMQAEMEAVVQDKSKSLAEQLEWIRERALQLQEERVEIQAEALDLEKRRIKWVKFRSDKEREMEKSRLGNERLMLENEQMVMRVRMKELELEHSRPGEAIDSTGFHMDREQGRDLIELI